MTYAASQVSYWVGQANDTSTGSHPSGWTNGQRWSETASEWLAMYNSSQSQLATMTTNYNNQVAAYNALLNGLNNPEGLVYVAISLGWPGQNATSGTATLTLSRTGHWFVGAVVDGTVNLQSYGSTITVNVGGVMSASKTTNCGANSGTQQYHAGFQIDGDFSAGQVIQANVSNQWVVSGSIGGTLFAHFIPNATYHN